MVSGVCYGHSRVPVQSVTPLQIERLVSELRSFGFGSVQLQAPSAGRLEQGALQIHSSPLPRCLELAKALGEVLGWRVSVEQSLIEMNFGEWEGRSWEQLASEDSKRLQTWMDHWRSEAPPGGESIPNFQHRVAEYWRKNGGTATLLVTHAGVIRALSVLFRGASWEQAMRADVPYLKLQKIL